MTAPTTGAIDIAGPPTIATTNAPPLTSLIAPLHVSSPSPIATWALFVPPLWSEAMIPMRHVLLLGTMTETWKVSPQTDRWNCQPRRGVMLCSVPSFIFLNYPLCFPSISPMFHPFIYQNPRTATLIFLATFKTLFPFAFTLFYSYDSIS